MINGIKKRTLILQGVLFLSRVINMAYNEEEGDLQWSKESKSSKASAPLLFFFTHLKHFF